MIRHSMDVVGKSVEKNNPGQVLIITVDQPLYTIAKHIYNGVGLIPKV